MKYSVRNQTQYFYSDSVAISYNRIHCNPKNFPYQSFSNASLTIDPEPAFLNQQTDFFGNPVTLFTIQESHQKLNAVLMFEAEVFPRTLETPTLAWEDVAQGLLKPRTPEELDASQFRFDSTWVKTFDKLTNYARDCFPPGRPVADGGLALCQKIFREFTFDNNHTDVSTPVREVLESKRGVCQDFAHLALGALRGLGLSARYVSGYLLTLPPPGKEKLQGADASHAWISLWAPPVGWIDFDPTNNCMVSQQHITLAIGRDYHDVCPLRGLVLGGGQQLVRVGVDVKEFS